MVDSLLIGSLKALTEKKFHFSVCVLVALFLLMHGGQVRAAGSGVAFVDVHTHLSGTYPERGFAGPPQLKTDYPAAAANLVATLDRLGVRRSVVMPPPQISGQKVVVTYGDLLAAVRRYPDRLVWGGGGDILNPLIVGTPASAVNPEIKKDFKTKARRIVQDGAKVFGEMAALHFSFSERHVFFQSSPDHPLWFLLADIAAETGVPIDLHMEAVLQDQATPPNLIARSTNNPARIRANIPAFEKLLAHNPRAKIVWCHIGWDNTGHMTIDLLRRLLVAHPNLYLSLKIVPPPAEPFRFSEHDVVDAARRIRPEWMSLFKDFSERFVVGSDEFVGISGQSRRSGPPSFEATWRPLLKQLPPKILDKIGGGNAARIYRLE